MRLLILALLALHLYAQDKPKPNWLYRTSIASAVAAQTADIASSWNRGEANPLYGQKFTAKDAVLKGAIAAGNLGVQSLILRKWPHAKKAAAVLNFVCAGAVTVVAIRNTR